MNHKLNIKKIIAILLFFISTIVFSISIFKIIKWKIDNNKTVDVLIEILDHVGDDEIDLTNKEVTLDKIEDLSLKDKFFTSSLKDINFDDLKKINNDTAGWIRVNGTNINYPFVKGSDNSFYLDHSFDKSKNGSGWIFMDYRNTGFFTDKNSILYAHGGSSKAFFNQLNRILDNNHFDKKDNHIIHIYDDQFIYGFEVFSAYHIKTTSDYIKTNFSNDNEFLSFINLIKNRSMYNFNIGIDTDDKILTLSTCYNKNEKMVVHAKLVLQQLR